MAVNVVKLGDVATISAGQSAPKSNYFCEEGIPFVRAGSLEFLERGESIDLCEKISEDNAQICRLKLYPKNSILFAKSGMSANKGRIYKLERSAYIVSHLAIITPDETKLIPEYLMYWLQKHPPKTLIKDESYPSIGLTDIANMEIELPPLDYQKKIAKILDKADEIRAKKKLANDKLDEFLKSTFISMFGDPVSNHKQIPQYSISKIGTVITGNTPSRKVEEYYGDYIEWIKSDNINTPYTYLTQATEHLSEQGAKVGRIVPNGSILVTCIAGSFDCVGNIALTNRKVAFNQQINAIIPNNELVDSKFLYTQLLIGKTLIQDKSTKSMKGMVSKGKFETIKVIIPDLSEQQQFVEIFNNVEAQKQKNQQVIEQMDNLFNSLSQRAFKGEL